MRCHVLHTSCTELNPPTHEPLMGPQLYIHAITPPLIFFSKNRLAACSPACC